MPANKRILFVDDEPNILAGLRRMLRGMRKQWAMTFVESGQAALNFLADNQVDIIVTDMRMPGIDGAELLRRVQTEHPGVVRIVLSGQADRDAVLDAVGAVHQYLYKPCDADNLKDTLMGVCQLDALLTDNELKAAISQLERAPSLPENYRKLVTELNAVEPSAATLGTLISRDMGMSAKILQLVNSAFFGLRMHIPGPDQAAGLLGVDTLRMLHQSATIFAPLAPDTAAELASEALWLHAYRVGRYAREIARLEGLDQRHIDYAYTAGLLHDLGKPLLATLQAGQYAKFSRLRGKFQAPAQMIDREQALFGGTHATVGAYLLGLWGLPPAVIIAVAYHHNPLDADAGFGPLGAVYAANVLAHQLHPDRKLTAVPTFDNTYLTSLGLVKRLPVWQSACLALS